MNTHDKAKSKVKDKKNTGKTDQKACQLFNNFSHADSVDFTII
jgi:hypothetical protein